MNNFLLFVLIENPALLLKLVSSPRIPPTIILNFNYTDAVRWDVLLPMSFNLTRIKVHYYEKQDVYTEGTKKGEGEILLVSPRHPSKGVHIGEPVTWKEALRDIDVDLEAAKWGGNPQQNADDVDSLTFCCSECCHTRNKKCQKLSECLCGAFPEHKTANQFFTPRMFAAYHREGYNACVEAEAADFLGCLPDE